MQEIKNGSIWRHTNGLNYEVLNVEPHDVMAMTDPNTKPDEEGYYWRGPQDLFLKEFKLQAS